MGVTEMDELAPGFYVGEDGLRRYWDGKQWLTPEPIKPSPQDGKFFEESPRNENPTESSKRNKPLMAVGIGIAIVLGLWMFVQAGNNVYSTGNDSVVEQEDSDPSTRESIGQSNAKAKAEQYLRTMPFSKSGLVKQLMFEGFSEPDANYAVNSITVDWNEQAAKKARQYLDTMSFSRSGLIKQLKFEGFSNAEAEFGVSSVGY